MYIILANLNSNAQYSYHSMYSEDFSKASFIDVEPSFNLRYGRGRIIMFQWNEFLRKIKRYLWLKKKNKTSINKFWYKTKFKTIEKYKPYLPKEVIDNIFTFI